MHIRVDTRQPLLILIVGLVAVCWLALLVWSASPYARYLNHESLEQVLFLTQSRYLILLAIFMVGWLLMTVAMMLPTVLPLLILFHRFIRRRPRPARLMALLICGYIAVWTLFGGLAHLGDWLLHQLVAQNQWLTSHAWSISVLTLLLAGIYEFVPFKYACLEQCRSPLNFIVQHWRGRHPHREALWLGVWHGLYCVGCCWSLMVLMFAVACGNVVWMLLLAIVMAIEKNLAWGRHISAPLGAALIGAGILVVAFFR